MTRSTSGMIVGSRIGSWRNMQRTLPASGLPPDTCRLRSSTRFQRSRSRLVSMTSPLEEFYDLRGRIRADRDPAMTELNHILAWLHLALGHVFVGLALTPADESNIQEILQACDQRWSQA